MAISKKSLNINLTEFVLIAFLSLFPFGQVLRLELSFLGNPFVLQPIDLVAGFSLIIFFRQRIFPPEYGKIVAFIAASVFSLLFSLSLFAPSKVFIGSLYLLRFIAYSSLFAITWRLVKTKSMKQTLFNSLIVVSFFVAIFGWIQYFWLPDLRDLARLGWDDHLFRLVSTFLDPGFTGIILTLGFLTIFGKFLNNKNKKLIWILVFFMVTLAFTYARAAYLALITGIFVSLFAKGKSFSLFNASNLKKFLWLILPFLSLLLFLPRPPSEGVRLERTYSINEKFKNYSQTLEIFYRQPVFGVGFNNLCVSRQLYLGQADISSHSCSGSDSSLLFVLATTGVVGFILFSYMGGKILLSVNNDMYGKTFVASASALLINSLFINSLFYPWIMGWMGILLALAVSSKREV